jgi:nitrous-oxide reductase
MRKRKWQNVLLSFLAVILTVILVVDHSDAARKRRKKRVAKADISENALKVYVAPGDLDEYYLFLSGGHGGNIYVYGIPSMRHLSTIPVFTPYPATGYGWDKESKEMLGGFTWGDAHHPALSETKGEYDGRWLFINDNANNRVARIDLRTFKTTQIIGPVPNVSGSHGSPYLTWNSEYLFMASRFSIPIPKGTYATTEEYKTKFKGVITGIAIDPKTGKMSVGWQILMPPWDFDKSDAGKKVSGDWAFFSCYNSEAAWGKLEVVASQRDRDYITAVNWKKAAQAVKDGKYTEIDGVKVIDPTKVEGIVFLLPVAKSPHGVDVSPDGKYVIGAGKLSPTVTVHSIEKMMKAIEKKDFSGTDTGLPVIRYKATKVAEVPVGLGPLHTVFDDKGYAYTSLFVESAIAKWSLKKWDVVHKVPVQYNVGHLTAAEGDTVSPDGNWLVSLNKLSKGTHLSTGPSIPESAQLIDISGEKMKLIYDAFPEPEPHYAQIIKADKIKTIEVYRKGIDNTNPNAIWTPDEAKIKRTEGKVEVWMMAVRSYFAPYDFAVNQGDKVIIHLTNIEQMRDELHGFAINEHDINVIVDPGETKTIEFVAEKAGVFPFYCTNFCSALHQEMQGYMMVKPK